MINIIVAVDKNLGIGKDNKLLAHIKSDLEYFKRTTNGHIIVMGYNTYLSLPKKPLPNRLNIVLTKKDIKLEGAIVVHSIDELFNKLKEFGEDREVFICGGESIYKQMMPYVTSYILLMCLILLMQIHFILKSQMNGKWKVLILLKKIYYISTLMYLPYISVNYNNN